MLHRNDSPTEAAPEIVNEVAYDASPEPGLLDFTEDTKAAATLKTNKTKKSK